MGYIIFNYSRLNSNISKCEVAGIGAVKRFHMAAYGLKSIDLTSDTLKILGVPFSCNKNIHFSYNEKIQNEKNFCSVIINI